MIASKISMKDKEIPFETILPGNRALVSSVPKPDIDRNQFYNDLNTMRFEEFAKKYIKLPDSETTFKFVCKNVAKYVYYIAKASGLNCKTLFQNVFYNVCF